MVSLTISNKGYNCFWVNLLQISSVAAGTSPLLIRVKYAVVLPLSAVFSKSFNVGPCVPSSSHSYSNSNVLVESLRLINLILSS